MTNSSAVVELLHTDRQRGIRGKSNGAIFATFGERKNMQISGENMSSKTSKNITRQNILQDDDDLIKPLEEISFTTGPLSCVRQ